MKLHAFSLVLLLSLQVFAHSESPQRIRYKVTIDKRTPWEVGKVSRWLASQNFDVAGTNWVKGEVEVITDTLGIDFLAQHGFVGMQAMGWPWGDDPPDSRYFNPQSLAEKVRALAAAFPQLARAEQIGTTLQGRPIMALLISTTPDANDARNLDKASILVDGQHHAREVMTPEVVMDMAEQLLQGYGSNTELTKFLDSWNVWLVPSVNPDGVNIVFTSDSMWRKNARGDSKPFGVDINRNYAYKWNGCRGSSAYTWAQDYRGTAPGSEPETQALMKLAQNIRPAAYLSYHSYSELVLFPYGCSNSLTPENGLIEGLAKEMAQRLPRDDKNGNYTPGTPWQTIYAADGSSMDYMYATFGALAYTFEINESFQPSYALRDPTVRKHRGAWGHLLGRLDQNLLKVNVVDGQTGLVGAATIDIDAIPHRQGESSFVTTQQGRFTKVLAPGHYLVTARLADGRSNQVSVDMAQSPQSVTIAVN